jgi:hypothetical protein
MFDVEQGLVELSLKHLTDETRKERSKGDKGDEAEHHVAEIDSSMYSQISPQLRRIWHLAGICGDK